jgi:hypothetical protein
MGRRESTLVGWTRLDRLDRLVNVHVRPRCNVLFRDPRGREVSPFAACALIATSHVRSSLR